MRPVLIIGCIAAFVLTFSGCVGTGDALTRRGAAECDVSGEHPGVADSLDSANRRYREALSSYVMDDTEQAGVLLEAALSALENTEPRTDEVLSAKASLASRITYFLDILATKSSRPARTEPPCDQVPVDMSPTVLAVTDTRESASPGREIAVTENARVRKWLRYFQGNGRAEMTRWLARRSRYRRLIEGILVEEGLPSDLLYLAMIESGLNPRAYSSAHASGMWQFIPSRARMYELRVDWWVDERRDPEKATRAACAYLKDLEQMFGSWPLAMAAYNSGEGRVGRARKRQPSCRDFWCLDLPRETENFVPKFMAALVIGSDPEAYGFSEYDTEPPLRYDSLELTQTTDIDVIAQAAGTTSAQIRALNPALRRSCTPSGDEPFTVHVPFGSGPRCLAELLSLPSDQRLAWGRHRVSKGETLSEIAAAHGTTVRAVAEVNKIRNTNRITAGDYLLIPGAARAGTAGAGDGMTYVVRPGDTVSSIAQRHGKNTNDILRWNGLGWDSKIYPGDKIRIGTSSL